MKSQVIIPKAPSTSGGRRPQRSRKMMAGRVSRTLMTYWIEAVSSGEAIWAPSMM